MNDNTIYDPSLDTVSYEKLKKARKALKCILGEEGYNDFAKNNPQIERKRVPSPRKKPVRKTAIAKPVSHVISGKLRITRQKNIVDKDWDPLNRKQRHFVTECGKEFRIARCKKGHLVVKRMHCDFDGCPICGRAGSETHIVRMQGIRPRALLMSNPYLFSVSFIKEGIDLLHTYNPYQFRAMTKRVASWARGLKITKWFIRWVFVNDRNEFDPTLNLFLDIPEDTDPDKFVDRVRYAVCVALDKILRQEVGKIPLEYYADLIKDIKYESVKGSVTDGGFVDYSKLEDAIYKFTRPAITPEAYQKDKAIAAYIYNVKNLLGYTLTKGAKKKLFGIDDDGNDNQKRRTDKLTGDVDLTNITKYMASREKAFKEAHPILYAISHKICPICGEKIYWAEIKKERDYRIYVSQMKNRKIKAPTPGVFSGKDPVVEQCETPEHRECDFTVYHFENDPIAKKWSEKVVERFIDEDKHTRLTRIKDEIRKAIKNKFREINGSEHKIPEEYRGYFTDLDKEAEILSRSDMFPVPFNNSYIDTSYITDKYVRKELRGQAKRNIQIGRQVKKEVLKSMLTKWEWLKLWKLVYDKKGDKGWKIGPCLSSNRGVRLEDMLIYVI